PSAPPARTRGGPPRRRLHRRPPLSRRAYARSSAISVATPEPRQPLLARCTDHPTPGNRITPAPPPPGNTDRPENPQIRNAPHQKNSTATEIPRSRKPHGP